MEPCGTSAGRAQSNRTLVEVILCQQETLYPLCFRSDIYSYGAGRPRTVASDSLHFMIFK